MQLHSLPTVLLALLPLVSSSVVHRSLPKPAGVIQQQPIITSPPKLDPTKTHNKRGVVSKVESAASDVAGDVNSILSGLGSNLPSWVASGVLPAFQSFPTGTAVQSSLGLNDSQVQALPTQVLNIP